jgi:hypothetical protein
MIPQQGLQFFLISSTSETSSTIDCFFDRPLLYRIFGGRSVLRELEDEATIRNLTKSQLALHYLQTSDRLAMEKGTTTSSSVYLDAAHEVLLGVNRTNGERAEFAAMNRGKTTWARDHPLDTTDDFLHSVIHRLEGGNVGEGNHTGYQNAKYWVAGGPKRWETLPTCHHPVYHALCELAPKRVPKLFQKEQHGLIAKEAMYHEIIAAGGLERSVQVQPESWDAVALINLWEHQCNDSVRVQLLRLHELELELWDVFEASRRTISSEEMVHIITDNRNGKTA